MSIPAGVGVGVASKEFFMSSMLSEILDSARRESELIIKLVPKRTNTNGLVSPFSEFILLNKFLSFSIMGDYIKLNGVCQL